MSEHITRQEACRRLIRAAITSFVRGDEPLLIHLAVQSAFRVCRDILKHRDPSADRLNIIIRPEMLKEFLSYYVKIANFLKHAERNPNAMIDIANINSLNEHSIFMACVYFWDAFPESRDPITWMFAGWYGKRHFEADAAEPSKSAIAFALQSEQEVWGMLQLACSMNTDERAKMAAATPGFDW